MLPPSVAEVGETYSGLVSGVVDDALELLDPAIQRGRSSPESWRDAVQSIGDRLLSMQVLVASMADPYLNDVLDAQNADAAADALVVAESFADLTDGGGSWLQNLVYAPNSTRDPSGDWVTRFDFVAQSVVKVGLTDTARSSTQTGMQARPATRWYARMLRGKSCSRCAILAGRRYRSTIAFNRHPRCDCVHIPAAEDAEDWATDPGDYFASLSTEDQDQVFTKAGAEAIRLGADIAQVVNARQGVYVARAHGDELLATMAGASNVAGIRLLPDEIFLQAERFGWDRAEVLRQLQRFGYLL